MLYQPKSDLLNNRIILVTGASDGIGREAALTYARYGAQVVLLARNAEKLLQVSKEVAACSQSQRAALWFALDLETATPENCQQLARSLAGKIPHLDGVLHNAGLLGEVLPMQQQDPAIWQQVMRVNIDGTFFLTQALLPLLLKSPAASLVFTSSSVGRRARRLGRLFRFQVRYRRHDAGAGTGVRSAPAARKLYQSGRYAHQNARQRLPG